MFIQPVEKRNASNAKVFRQIIFYLKDEAHPESSDYTSVVRKKK